MFARPTLRLATRLAGVAQLVEQLIRNQQVVGSSPTAGSNLNTLRGLTVSELGLDDPIIMRKPRIAHRPTLQELTTQFIDGSHSDSGRHRQRLCVGSFRTISTRLDSNEPIRR